MNVVHCVKLLLHYSPASSRSRTLSVFNSFTRFVEPKIYICPFIQRNSSFASAILRTSCNQNCFHICKKKYSKTRGVFNNSILRKELRKYDDYAQYPRSALILRVLSKKRWPSTAAGKVVSQYLDSVLCWQFGMRWSSQCWPAPDFRDYSNRRE